MLKNKTYSYNKKYFTIKNYLFILALTILLISVVSVISAAGVSTPYWKTNPLKLQPGESTVFSLGLQNMVGSEDITLRANMTKGNEVARIIDEKTDYFVPLGSDSVTVNIEVTIPPNAEINKVYDLEVSFLQVSSVEGEGFFTVASAFTQRIPVLVVGEPTESSVYQPTPTKSQKNNLLWIALAVIVLGIVVFFVARGKKRKI